MVLNLLIILTIFQDYTLNTLLRLYCYNSKG